METEELCAYKLMQGKIAFYLALIYMQAYGQPIRNRMEMKK